eukprot:TRINITY_DN276_c0_g2_i1.p1 TRINITY_DN276_c0_g2~~TRINITY_DN276_c0_g2_i1.p1  ORF type:complete len:300 (-),score=75.41 TRINITY_DN276_c0_g2_i1:224-1123(-)
MKGAVTSQVNDLLSKMLGVRPEDVLSEEEINQHLTDAFNKFDVDRSGQLGQWEFTQAWVFLGLKGTEAEINDSFKSVDVNSSGLVDLNEFLTAIKGSRMAELSLANVLSKMGVQLNNLDGQFDNFKATEKRRRLMKKEYEENVAKVTKDIIKKLATVSNRDVPQKDPEGEQLYNTLKDTFNAFDSDGSAELGFPEYKEAWKFLNRPGGEADIKAAFDSVDVDGSGLVEWAEFAFSLMGEKALDFGPLADLELLNDLLSETASYLVALQNDLEDANMSTKDRMERNAELRSRLRKHERKI